MDIKFECRNCGQHIVIDEGGAGLTVQCPDCNGNCVVPTPEREPLTKANPCLSADYYHILQGNSREGPYTLAQVAKMLTAKEITLEALYAQPGMTEWLPLSENRHLFEEYAPGWLTERQTQSTLPVDDEASSGSIDIEVGMHADLWAQAITEAFAMTGSSVTVVKKPVLRSVAADVLEEIGGSTSDTTMIDVTTAMDSRRDRAILLLLSRFLRPEDLKDLSAYWKDPLGESPYLATQRLIDKKLLEQAPLDVMLEIKCRVTELKSLLRKKGLKCTGRKAELIARLIEYDLESIQKMAARWKIFQCSRAGRVLALEFEDASETERKEAETEVLAFLMQGDYRNASLRMAEFESKQVFGRGVGVDWANYDPEQDVQTLQFIFTGWPGILRPVHSELKDALRLGAAMMELFGQATATQWLEEIPETGSHLDPNTVMRMLCFYGGHQREMREFKCMGVRSLRILGGDDEDACPHCAALNGRKFPINKAPELPLPTCTSLCGCRCLALANDFGSSGHAITPTSE